MEWQTTHGGVASCFGERVSKSELVCLLIISCLACLSYFHNHVQCEFPTVLAGHSSYKYHRSLWPCHTGGNTHCAWLWKYRHHNICKICGLQNGQCAWLCNYLLEEFKGVHLGNILAEVFGKVPFTQLVCQHEGDAANSYE